MVYHNLDNSYLSSFLLMFLPMLCSLPLHPLPSLKAAIPSDRRRMQVAPSSRARASARASTGEKEEGAAVARCIEECTPKTLHQVSTILQSIESCKCWSDESHHKSPYPTHQTKAQKKRASLELGVLQQSKQGNYRTRRFNSDCMAVNQDSHANSANPTARAYRRSAVSVQPYVRYTACSTT